jgi:hypothetical protein
LNIKHETITLFHNSMIYYLNRSLNKPVFCENLFQIFLINLFSQVLIYLNSDLMLFQLIYVIQSYDNQ